MNVLADATSTGALVRAAISLVIWIGIILWTVSIARRKGRSPVLWGILAFFFSLIALIIVAILPRTQVGSA